MSETHKLTFLFPTVLWCGLCLCICVGESCDGGDKPVWQWEGAEERGGQ